MRKLFIFLLVTLLTCPYSKEVWSENSNGARKEYVEQLIEKLDPQNRADIRRKAIEELGDMGAKEAVPELIKALRDKELTVKRRTCIALGKIKDIRAVPALIQRLEDHKENWSVQLKSAEALANIGDPTAFESLINALKYECETTRKNLDPHPRYSFGTADGVIELRMANALFDFVVKEKKQYIPLLLQYMNKERKMSKCKYYLAKTLGHLGEKSIVPVLIEYLRDSEDGLFREGAARLLGDLGDKRAIEPLKQALKDEYICVSTGDVYKVYGYTVRRAAAQSLKKLGLKIKEEGDNYEVIE